MDRLVTLSSATAKTVAISGHAVFRPRCESLTSRMDRRYGCPALCSGSGSGGGPPNVHRAEPSSPPRRSAWELNAGNSDAAVCTVNCHSASFPCSAVCCHPGDGRSSTRTRNLPTVHDNWRSDRSEDNSCVFPVFHFLVPPFQTLQHKSFCLSKKLSVQLRSTMCSLSQADSSILYQVPFYKLLTPCIKRQTRWFSSQNLHIHEPQNTQPHFCVL